MNEYILIFRHEDASKVASPEQMQQWMQQMMEWINGIAMQNKFSDGKGLLFDEARVVRSDNSNADGAFGKSTETIGGYIIVKAESIEEAVGFAQGCPILQGDGNSVEVRRIAR